MLEGKKRWDWGRRVRVLVVFDDYSPPRSRCALAAPHEQSRSPSFPREIRNYCIQAFPAESDLGIDRGIWSLDWDCRNNSDMWVARVELDFPELDERR